MFIKSVLKNNKAFFLKRIFVLWSLFILGFGSCVPIEDLLNPVVNNLELEAQYNVTDTLYIRANIFDNFGIGRINISVESIQNPSTGWSFTQRIDSVRARRLELDTFRIIPPNIPLGEYEITLTVTDINGLENSTSGRFLIDGDIFDPVFVDVIIPELELIEENLYEACRSDIIEINGTARDNVGLSQLRVQLGTFPPIVRALTGQREVDLGDVFDSQIIIPNNVPNGTTLPLVLQATDIDGNVSEAFEINILVDCDDVLPQVSFLRTSPAALDGVVELIRGEELFITGGQIADDQALDSVFIFFINGDEESLIASESVENETSVSLGAIFGDIAVPIPSDARVGQTYQIVAFATDLAGNESEPLVIDIEILRNAPPQILIANTYIDNEEVDIEPFVPASIFAGSTFRIEGKIEEDIALEYYEVEWGVEGRQELVVELDANDLEGVLTFNLASTLAENEFSIDENARSGTRYVLSLYVKDFENEEVFLEYVFIVGQ